MNKLLGTLLCFGLLVAAEVICAHHAPYIYDTQNEHVISGTVESFDWVQPHTWVALRTVDAEGVPGLWMLEGMNPLFLGRRGWTRLSLQPGDSIEVTFFPRRDGSRKGMFLRAIMPDGSMKVMATNP